ncbi:hypothetical protein H7X46_07890 [Pseudonocardia sp. C8]|uniref:hypothetical protein n=1 Tax=Pseudonocardia sp. C8 TaxID=2762759 RepID=UPI0016429F95|nr:hypothetical protein [Pseudonocardia sp. C8]MBC3190981.1 hypothetical protein [Pseudonocardia sp. C8]
MAHSGEHTTDPQGIDGADAGEARQGVAGAVEVLGMVVRVAGPVACRVDMRFAGTPQRQLGLSMGPVLIYLQSQYTAARVARQWRSAAPLVASLPTVLAGRRRGVMTAGGPWSTATMIRLGGAPTVSGGLVEPRPGSEAAVVLRMRVGPLVWELCDAAAYTATVRGWTLAAQMLAVDGDDL